MDIFWNYTISFPIDSCLAQLYYIIGALGSLEKTSKAERDLFMVSDAIVEKENIHNSLKEEIFSFPPLWKFQSSYILNTFEFFGLPEPLPPPQGNSNPFCGRVWIFSGTAHIFVWGTNTANIAVK